MEVDLNRVDMKLILSVACFLGSPILGQQTEECDEGFDCLAIDDCEFYQSEVAKLRSLERNSSERNGAKKVLQNLICSKDPRKICCPSNSRSTPTWVPPPGECGIRRSDAAFIIGGEDTKPGEFPWMALLGSKNSQGTIEWTCGGALINKWYVLSAAHCRDKEYVRLGEWEIIDPNEFDEDSCSYYNDISKKKCESKWWCGSQCHKENDIEHPDIEISREIVHPDYSVTNIASLTNDIMLIKLSKPAVFSKYVRPICLPDLDLTKLLGEPENNLNFGSATVVGWGTTYNLTVDNQVSIAPTPKQQKLEVPLVAHDDCVRKWRNIGVRKFSEYLSLETQICAGGENGKGSCEGDSGGPLITQKTDYSPFMIVGIVSFGTGHGSCAKGIPSVYTRVSSYKEWIIDNLV